MVGTGALEPVYSVVCYGLSKTNSQANPRERRHRYIIAHVLGVRVLRDKYNVRLGGSGVGNHVTHTPPDVMQATENKPATAH